MLSDPGLHAGERRLASGDVAQDLDGLRRSYPVQGVIVQLKEDVRALKRRPLVPVKEWVVPDDAKYQLGGLERYVAFLVLSLGGAPCRFEAETQIART